MLCQLAHRFPPFVEGFLERGRPLRRRFREETITDLLMGSLIVAGGRRIIVEFPDEPVTGADMEWNFANPDDGTFFRILLQAKRSYGEGKIWTRHGYKELLHKVGSGPKLQAAALCDEARTEKATYPLYVFYHPEGTCAAATAAGFETVAGVHLADGYLIERLVTAATTRALRTRNKSLGTIAPLLFPLSKLFCPPTVHDAGPQAFAPGFLSFPMRIGRAGGRTFMGVPMPPQPHEIRNRIARIREAMVAPTAEFPVVPEVSNKIPVEIMAAIERVQTGTVQAAGLSHWRVTFISANLPDMDAELDRLRQGSG